MRRINEIIIHCSAVRPSQTSTIEQIDRWHKQRGWRGIGYHYVIYRDGSVHQGRPEAETGAHCLGHNAHSIGICYEGGLNAQGKAADTRTEAQRTSLTSLLVKLKHKYPNAKIHSHRDFANKSCPCFDATHEYAHL